MLEGKTSLIIVNDASSAGYLELSKRNFAHYEKIGILCTEFYFDAFPFPAQYNDSYIASLSKQGPYKSNRWAVSSLRDFLKVDLLQYEKITLWFGNTTSEKMFLYFFARYYGRPFYVVDYGAFAEEGRPMFLDIMGGTSASDMLLRERLITKDELCELQRKANNLLINDTGFHALDEEGEVHNVSPEAYSSMIYEILEKNGGSMNISHLIGQMMGNLPFNSEKFDNKLIAWHLNNGLLRSTWGKSLSSIRLLPV